MALTDLERAYNALANKRSRYTLLWRYYDAEPPIRYLTERLREVFKATEARFSQNLASVVIDAEADRIRLKEFTVTGNVTAQDRLNELFQLTELEIDADDLHLAALVCGEAFLVVGTDDSGQAEAYYNDPRLCHVFYRNDRPHEKRMAVKWWDGDDDDRRYMTLYYPDRIEYYVSDREISLVHSADAFIARQPTEDNPYGVIPVFHFRRERRRIISALKNVIEPQDAHNKLFQDMMVAAEFGAFPQRWAISNADLSTLRNAPNEIWNIPAGDGEAGGTAVGSFPATNLANYLDAMDKLAAGICITTRTPKHYIFGQNGDPSGEALIAMEAPLNKKAQKTINRLVSEWKQVAAFLLRVAGVEGVNATMISPVFDRPETVQPRTEAEIRQMDVATGIPLRTALRRAGWTDAQIGAMESEPPNRQDKTFVKVVTELKDVLPLDTLIRLLAPYLGLDEEAQRLIIGTAAIERDARARAEARAVVNGLLGGEDETQTGAPADVQSAGTGNGTGTTGRF